jgi:protease I
LYRLILKEKIMVLIPEDIYQPETANRNTFRSVLILTADSTEDLEFFYPYYRFIEAGFKVDVATPDGGAFSGKHMLGLKKSMKIAEVDAEDYVLLYLPGGKAPAELRENRDALALTKDFIEEGKPISAVCHGPQILAAAGVIKGYRIAAFPAIENEIRIAGGTYVNQEVLIDGPFITARWPGDLPALMKATLGVLEKGNKWTRQAA